MFKNKHIIAALIITPILAIIGYFATDHLVSEKPHKARPGMSYQLVEMPNCRYESGHCGLKNADFNIDMQVELLENGTMNLSLDSAYPLNGVKLAVVDNPADSGEPLDMVAKNKQRTRWLASVRQPGGSESRIRLVISANASLYYGDVGTAFMVYKPAFDKDFRREGDQSK